FFSQRPPGGHEQAVQEEEKERPAYGNHKAEDAEAVDVPAEQLAAQESADQSPGDAEQNGQEDPRRVGPFTFPADELRDRPRDQTEHGPYQDVERHRRPSREQDVWWRRPRERRSNSAPAAAPARDDEDVIARRQRAPCFGALQGSDSYLTIPTDGGEKPEPEKLRADKLGGGPGDLIRSGSTRNLPPLRSGNQSGNFFRLAPLSQLARDGVAHVAYLDQKAQQQLRPL